MIGQTLGNYRVVQLLGDGGMGSVYRAVDEMLDREVAIKVLRPELTRQEALVERFRQEARALARLSHPGIAILHGMERHGDEFLMIMEYVRGDTLEKLVERSGRLAWARATELCIAILHALDHAHDRQIVHRDIKPANVMLSSSGSVKVMDFGIARMLGKNRQTQFGHAVGTPTYMAPEQLRGEDVDRRTDLYAVGAVLYELITGRIAFEADSDYQLMMLQLNEPPPPASASVPDVPEEIDRIIWRAMAKQRDERYSDATELSRALQRVLSAHDGAASRVAAPATRLGAAAASVTETASTPLSGSPVGETRLAGGGFVSGAGGVETRLAGERENSPAAGWGHGAPAAAAAAGATSATRMAAATRWVSETLPDWKLDWRTWLAAGALFVATGFVAMAVRGPADVLDKGARTADAADASATESGGLATLASADEQPVVQTGGSGNVLPEAPRESAGSLIINPPAPGGGGRSGAGAAPDPKAAERQPTQPTNRTPERQNPETPLREPVQRDQDAVTPPPQPPDRREEAPRRTEQTEAEARAAISSALGGLASQMSGRTTGTAEALLGGEVRDRWVALMREGRISMGIDGTPDVRLNGDSGSAEFAATVNIRSPFGANRRQSARFAAQLVRQGERWVVSSLRPVGSLDLR